MQPALAARARTWAEMLNHFCGCVTLGKKGETFGTCGYNTGYHRGSFVEVCTTIAKQKCLC